jgi:hypothetical protein
MQARERSKKEYQRALDTLIQLSEIHNFHIICKIKQYDEDNKGYAGHAHKNVSLVPSSWGTPLADFLFADVVLVLIYSTAFYEAILSNPKTIHVNFTSQKDEHAAKEFNLLYASTEERLSQLVKDCITQPETIVTEGYEERRKAYIRRYLGEHPETSADQAVESIFALT